MIRHILTSLLARDTHHRKGLPPITPARAQLREQISEAEARCQCKRVGELRGRMRTTLHEELAACRDGRKR